MRVTYGLINDFLIFIWKPNKRGKTEAQKRSKQSMENSQEGYNLYWEFCIGINFWELTTQPEMSTRRQRNKGISDRDSDWGPFFRQAVRVSRWLMRWLKRPPTLVPHSWPISRAAFTVVHWPKTKKKKSRKAGSLVVDWFEFVRSTAVPKIVLLSGFVSRKKERRPWMGDLQGI